LKTETINRLSCELNDDWKVSDDQTTIERRVDTKNFADAMSVTQIAALLAEKENHHPDICLGWGYCRITFTTHSSKGLTELDFSCAQKLDKLLQTLTK
jgi:4a-hydroxytetrahydrobiopterin dehydratase